MSSTVIIIPSRLQAQRLPDKPLKLINQKEMIVEVEFTIGRREYKVIRGAKPNKFELYVNDMLVDQDATVKDYQEHLEKNVLKMSYRSFTQVAILGSANFTPFMQLKSAERRKLVEDLLDISIFSTMKDILRKKVSAHKIESKETNHEVELIEERVSGLNEQLEALRETRELKIQKYEDTVQETQDNIDTLLEKVSVKEEDEIIKVVDKLDNSYLCIQGPPGSGKTFVTRSAFGGMGLRMMLRTATIVAPLKC